MTCLQCGRIFPIDDGVPELLVEPTPPQHAPSLVGRAAAALVSRPGVYDAVQALAGAKQVARRIEPLLSELHGTVLDVGAGTGALERVLPAGTEYIWLDSDRAKLAGFRTRSGAPAVLGDAMSLPFHDESLDWASCALVLHHLDDAGLDRALGELRRVVRHGVFVIDPIPVSRLRSRLLWRYDRGRHPRTSKAIRSAVASRFSLRSEAHFTVLHTYYALTAVK